LSQRSAIPTPYSLVRLESARAGAPTLNTGEAQEIQEGGQITLVG